MSKRDNMKTVKANLWNQPDIPHKGWVFVSVHDNETAAAICEMCGNERIRYVHTMEHPTNNIQLDVGCVCAEKMSDDYVNPRRRERALRNAAAKRLRDKKRKFEQKETQRQAILNATWRESKNGNPYLRVYLEYKHGAQKIHAVVVKSKFTDTWAFAVNGVFSAYNHTSAEAAKLAARQTILRKFT
jgi:hypothetical protein